MSALEQTGYVAAPIGLSDERLAGRVPSDPTAFTELHERYEQPLLRYTRSLLRDPHDAADAAQDAWTRAFAALSSEPLRVLSVRSWLFAIARNACMDRMREGKRCAPADIDERALGTSPGADDVLELRVRVREALKDLAGLSERQRAAVVLRDLNGLEGDELARALDIDERRASWLVTDARRSLAEVRSGRGLSCEATRDALEHSRVRTRAIRAHIAGCPECDGFARRRIAARIHLHGIGLFLLALPARMRGLLKPAGAITAATVVAGVPAIHVLHGGGHAPRAPHAATTPAPRHASAPPAVVLRAAAPARRTAPVRAGAKIVVHAAAPAAASSAPAPAWHAATAPSARPAAAPNASVPSLPKLVPAGAAAPVRRTVQRVTAAVTALVPAAAPATRVANDVLADL